MWVLITYKQSVSGELSVDTVIGKFKTAHDANEYAELRGYSAFDIRRMQAP